MKKRVSKRSVRRPHGYCVCQRPSDWSLLNSHVSCIGLGIVELLLIPILWLYDFYKLRFKKDFTLQKMEEMVKDKESSSYTYADITTDTITLTTNGTVVSEGSNEWRFNQETLPESNVTFAEDSGFATDSHAQDFILVNEGKELVRINLQNCIVTLAEDVEWDHIGHTFWGYIQLWGGSRIAQLEQERDAANRQCRTRQKEIEDLRSRIEELTPSKGDHVSVDRFDAVADEL